MKHKLSFAVLIIFSTIVFVQCKKEKTVQSKEVLLRDKSVQEARGIVTGNWKIHFRTGGFTGNTRTTLNNSYFRYLSNDSIYLTFDNQLFAADKAIFQRRQTANFNWTACIMDFHATGGSAFSWMVDMKIGDTLVLVDDASNPDGYLMTKLP